MSETSATIVRNDATLAEQLSVELTVEGSTRWFGSFKLSGKLPLPLDSRFTLILPDGRKGEAQVTRVAYAGPHDPVKIHFRGVGTLA